VLPVRSVQKPERRWLLLPLTDEPGIVG
jgi:hypothetical protein